MVMMMGMAQSSLAQVLQTASHPQMTTSLRSLERLMAASGQLQGSQCPPHNLQAAARQQGCSRQLLVQWQPEVLQRPTLQLKGKGRRQRPRKPG